MGSKFVQDPSVAAFKAGFTPYPRYILRTGLVSAPSTAGYLWFISHDPDFEITKPIVMRAFPDFGETKYRRMMAELDWFKLVIRERENNKYGRIEHNYSIRVPPPEEVEKWTPFEGNIKKPRKPKQNKTDK